MTDNTPKSALELAMERLRQKDKESNAPERPLTDEQKAAIAEVRQMTRAKTLSTRSCTMPRCGRRQPREVAQRKRGTAARHERVGERDRTIAAIRREVITWQGPEMQEKKKRIRRRVAWVPRSFSEL